MSVALHDFITKYNVLASPTASIRDYVKKHPQVFRAVLLVNHIFRAVSLIAFRTAFSLSPLAGGTICFAGSLFYRLTVETNCAYKFALPAFAGSLVIPLGMAALKQLITGVAFASMGAFALTLGSLVPLSAYLSYIVLTVSYDVK